MLFVGTSIIHPSTEGVFLLCNILDLLIYSKKNKNGFTWILQKQNNSRIDEKIFLLYDNHQGFYSK